MKDFWRGGFIGFAAVFMTGVLVTLILFGIATRDVQKAEREIGRCEGACRARGFVFSNVVQNGNGWCACWDPGKPDDRTIIDPRDPIDCSR